MSVEELYKCYEILTEAKDKVSEHTKEYSSAIEAAKGNEKEKLLAAQIITKFFKHFPTQQNHAISAMISMCKDENTPIRIASLKNLPLLCKEAPNFAPKVASIICTLLTHSEQEHNAATSTLSQLLKDSTLQVIRALFKVISNSDNADLRLKILKLLFTKVKTLDSNAEIDDELIKQSNNLLICCNADEFILLMTYLTSSKLAKTFVGQMEIIQTVADKLNMDQPFDASHSYNYDKFISCVKFILPFFSTQVESKKFVIYYCDHIIPRIEEVESLPDGKKTQIVLLQQFAQLTTYCGKLDTPSVQISQVFDKLKAFMPEPKLDSTELPHVSFTIVECLLYAFHKLASQSPDFLTCNEETLREFRSYLMYLSRIVQGCQKVIEMSGTEKIFSPEEKKMRETPIKVLQNITSIIKDLFYKPPQYKCNVVLSFVTPTKRHLLEKTTSIDSSANSAPTPKKHVPITFDSDASNGKDAKSTHGNRTTNSAKKLYQPPSGKFSNSFGDNRRGRFSGGRGGGGGGPRGGHRMRGKQYRPY